MKTLSPTNAGSLGRAVKGLDLRLIALLTVVFAVFAIPALAQEATIVGTITDPSGAAVANATIVITNVETGVARTLPSNGDGQYVAPDLIIGRYKVHASASGFKAAEQKDIVLNVGDRTRIDFKLQVGSTTEQITVEANAVAVQTDTGEVSNVITGQQVTQLATNGRSLYSLFALAPGAVSLQGSRIAFTPVSGDSTVSINGERAGHNLQLIDGGENLDRGGSSGSVMPSIDSLAEFRNMTSNYSAEYGLASASQISSVIKSGTRQFHAEAWEFFRNDDLDARNYFTPAPAAVPELRYNVYGFNAGGKIPGMNAHPTFFFYNMEWRKEIDGGLLNVPMPPASAYPDAAGDAVIPSTYGTKTLSVVVPYVLSGTPPAPVAYPNEFANCPGGVAPTGVTPGSPFPANTIPSCMVNSNAVALLTAGGKYGGIFPQPTSGTNFVGGNNSPTDLREEIARIDHTFTNKFSVFGHWISEQTNQTYGTTQWSGDNSPSAANTFANPSYSAVIHTTYIISPTLLNEASFNYNGNRIAMQNINLFTAPSTFQFNRLFSGPNVDNRIPSIDLTGVTGSDYTVNWMPWHNAANDYQLRDDLSWTKGAHQLKFGFSWAIYKKVQDAFANTEGNFTFNGSFTSPVGCTSSTTVSCGYDFADYLLGYASNYSEDGAKITGHWNNISPAAYAQDNWRVNNRLTLNLGLRWDGIPHTYEANHLSSNFYPNLYNFADAATFDSGGNICGPNSPSTVGFCGVTTPGGANTTSPGVVASTNPNFTGYNFYLNGIGVGGVNGIPKGLVNNSWNNWGPRLGFAYDLTGHAKTVVRGGFGMSYERIQGNDMYNGAVNPPGDPNPTLLGVSLSNPGQLLSGGAPITAANLPILPLGVTGIATHYPTPVSFQYSAGVQQAVGTNAVLNIAYVGSQGRRENYYQAINLPPLTDLGNFVNTTAHTANGLVGGPSFNEVLTYPGFGNMRLAFDGANSTYNSLQTSLTGTVKHDLHLQVSYTLAKAMDATTSTGSGGDLENATNPYQGWRYDFGPSVYDRRSVFFANFVYDLPIFRNTGSRLLKSTLGGWEFSGIVTEETGAPVNLGVNGETAASIIGNTSTRPNVNGAITYPKTKDGTTVTWFNGSSFSAPTCAPGGPGTDCYGNLGFDAIRGPGHNNFDLSLLKNFAFTERFRMEFRAEAFNAFNHTEFEGNSNLGGLSNNVGASNFGQITSAYDGRQFQLGLKLIY